MAACAQVISTALGYVLPNLISRKATQHAASVLYTFFGLRLLWIAWHAKPQETNQARGPLAPRGNTARACMPALSVVFRWATLCRTAVGLPSMPL